jgi:hypothetical protein
VFDGEVEAIPLASGNAPASPVTIREDQAARIDGRSVALTPVAGGARFVRAILPPPVVEPRSSTLEFVQPVAGSILDGQGQGVGLTHRLPGTGDALPAHDTNLRLDPRRGVLELTATVCDINQQYLLGTGEYLGLRLADLGLADGEDFAISATLADIPGLAYVGQFGLYAGTRSDRMIRGGLISDEQPDRYKLFLVNNDGGRDADLYEVGLMNTGDDLRLTLRRFGGAYSLLVEDLTRHSSSTLAIAHPGFLDDEHDLHVGLFVASPRGGAAKALTVEQVRVTVWHSAGSDPDDTSP